MAQHSIASPRESPVRRHVYLPSCLYGVRNAFAIDQNCCRLFVMVGGVKSAGDQQPRIVDIGVEFSSGKWHAIVICHKRSTPLLFNKDQLEVSNS